MLPTRIGWFGGVLQQRAMKLEVRLPLRPPMANSNGLCCKGPNANALCTILKHLRRRVVRSALADGLDHGFCGLL